MLGCLSCAAARASRRNCSVSALTELPLSRNLDCYGSIELRVLCFPNRTKCPDAKTLGQGEVANGFFTTPVRFRFIRTSDQGKTASTGRTDDLMEGEVLYNFDRVVAMGAADTHGLIVRWGIESRHDSQFSVMTATISRKPASAPDAKSVIRLGRAQCPCEPTG